MTEMDEKANVKVLRRPSSTLVKSGNKDYFISSRGPRYRFFINPPRLLRQDFMQDHVATRALSQTTAVIHPIGEEGHQESCRADTQEHGSPQTEHQMLETAIQTKTKSMEMDNKESTSPHFQPEQSLVRRAIRFLIILFIILGVFYIIVIGSQAGYSWDLWIQKVRFGKFSPPI